MNKQLAIKWLQGYASPPDSQDEDAALLASDLGIKIEEAQKIVAEYEEKLVKLFTAWKKDILLEKIEGTDASPAVEPEVVLPEVEEKSTDRAKAVKWFEKFICAHCIKPEEDMRGAPMVAAVLHVTLDEATDLIAECEERLVEMFLEWYNEVAS